MTVKITCYSADFLGEIQASAEIEEVKWLGYQGKGQCSPVTKLILEWLKSEGMIE